MKCEFPSDYDKECNEKCIYWKTCTRSPYKKEKVGKKDGRCEVDKSMHRHI